MAWETSPENEEAAKIWLDRRRLIEDRNAEVRKRMADYLVGVFDPKMAEIKARCKANGHRSNAIFGRSFHPMPESECKVCNPHNRRYSD